MRILDKTNSLFTLAQLVFTRDAEDLPLFTKAHRPAAVGAPRFGQEHHSQRHE
jgi:hypothetical protein